MDFNPIFSKSSVDINLTANLVATGIKNGVSTSPCLVFNIPRRAFFEVEIILNITFNRFMTIKRFIKLYFTTSLCLPLHSEHILVGTFLLKILRKKLPYVVGLLPGEIMAGLFLWI